MTRTAKEIAIATLKSMYKKRDFIVVDCNCCLKEPARYQANEKYSVGIINIGQKCYEELLD